MRIILIMVSSELDLPLRWVLMIGFSRIELAALAFGAGAEVEVARWPGCFYRVVVQELCSKAWVEARVARALEARLSEPLARHRNASLADLSCAFRDATEAAAGLELAAILWILVKRAQPRSIELARRLAREAEVVAARRLVEPSNSASYLRAPRSPEADRLSAIG
jgi:hypothetical protein